MIGKVVEMKKIFAIIALVLVLFVNPVFAKEGPCDEEITDKNYYQNVVLNHPEVVKLKNFFGELEVIIPDCFVKETAVVTLKFQAVKNIQLILPYKIDLFIELKKNLQVVDRAGKNLDAAQIIDFIKNLISEIEMQNRILEFIEKMKPEKGSIGIYDFDDVIISLYGNSNYITSMKTPY